MVEVVVPLIVGFRDQPEAPVLGNGLYRTYFKEKTGGFVFRKVKDVRPGKLISISYTTVDQDGNELKKTYSTLPTVSAEEYEKNIKEYHESGTFTTYPTPMRRESDKNNTPIFGNLDDVAELNIGNLEFMRQTDPEYRYVLPRRGDLVCGTVENRNGEYHFSNWFICSDQFLKAWTAILFDSHESFVKKGVPVKDEEEFKRYMFGGNYLMTNSYLKFVLGCHESKVTATHDDLKKRYYDLRTEATSRGYVHVYAAMVLIARYGGWPCDYNVPTNHDNKPKMIMWDLPPNWLTYIGTVFGIQTRDFVEFIEIPRRKK